MKKRIRMVAAICIAIILFIAAILYVFLRFGGNRGYSVALSANWGVGLPLDSDVYELFQMDSGASFHGDGIRYHVFASRSGRDSFAQMLPWTDSCPNTIHGLACSWALNEYLDELEVPESDRPSLEGGRWWYDSKNRMDEIIVWQDTANHRIYIVESFI